LDEPLVGVGIGAEDELQAVPFQPVAHGSVDGVDCRERTDHDAVLVVDDLVHTLVVELV
ncbi:MAG: hypothetical protein GWN94_08625, partial [Phycisphaerae bacterium]|nr:hypothetical protein [Phycisphaerae bacterium]